MAAFTLAQAETKVTEYLTAIEKVLAKQSYSIGGRSVSYTDLGSLQAGLEFWQKQVERLSRGGIRITGATPT